MEHFQVKKNLFTNHISIFSGKEGYETIYYDDGVLL